MLGIALTGWLCRPADVLASGNPPAIDAGINKTLPLPARDLTLFGRATDPEGDPLVVQWTRTSGPAPVSFSAPSALTTTVSFSVPGTYTFQLFVSDGTNNVTSNTTVTVLSAASQTAFYVDPTYTGGNSNGSSGHPWTTLSVNSNSAVWTAINTALAVNNVVVYFSARQAASDTPEIETHEVNLYRTDGSTHRLTLDGMSKYNANDASPSWLDYSGSNKFHISIVNGFISIGTQNENYPTHYTTIRGFDVSGDSGRILYGGNYTVVEYMHVHDVLTIGSTIQFQRAVLADCSAFFGNLHDITLRNNDIDHGFGEAIYIGSNYLTAGGCASWGNAHSDVLIESNNISNPGFTGGQGDGIDVKAGVLNVTIRNNVIHDNSTAQNPAGITTDGVFPGAPGNYLIENNRIYNGASSGIRLQSQNQTVVRNNLIYNTGTGLSVTGSVAPSNFNIDIYNNTVVNNSAGVSIGDADKVNIKNNIVFGNGGGAVKQATAFSSTNLNSDYNLYGPTGAATALNEGPHAVNVLATASVFVDPINGDYRLIPGSPAIDKGLDLGANGFTRDLSGLARGQLTGWDIGAYELLDQTAATVTLETAPDGSGTVLGSQIIAAGSSITAYAIERNSMGSFISNAAATWSLLGTTGGIVNADLASAITNKSAVFTGTIAGTTTLHAVAGALSGNSGVLTVSQPPASVVIETSADGTGVPVGAQNVSAGSSLMGFAILRDGSGNFISNTSGNWSLTNSSGGVTSGDLIPSGDNKSAIFTGHIPGSATLHVLAGAFNGNSGALTVVTGPAVSLTVETAANGAGSLVGTQNVQAATSITGFAIERDIAGNFVANVAVTWSLASTTGGVANADLVPSGDNKSAAFTGHFVGSAKLHVVIGGLTGNSGVLTTVAGVPASVGVETAANGSGVLVGAQSVASTSSVIGFAVQRDGFGNFKANVASNWSLVNVTGGIVNGDLVASGDGKSATFTGHAVGTTSIRAVAVTGGLAGNSGTLSVSSQAPATVTVETASDGTGTVITAQNVTAGATVTGFAIQRDGSGTFLANIAATWSLTNVTGGVVNGDLVVAADSKSVIFTGHIVGAATIRAVSNVLTGNSGALTVVASVVPASVTVETAANGSGLVIAAQNIAAGTAVTGFAIQRDGSGNFISNTAASWSLTAVGGDVGGSLVPAPDSKSAVFTAQALGALQLTAVAGGLTGSSGTLTVIPGGVSAITLENAANGSGSSIGAENISAGSSQVAFAIQRDAFGNFIANVAATWSLLNVTGGVINSDLVPAGDNKSATFTAHVIGTVNMKGVAGGLIGTSGTLTIVAGTPTSLNVETSANGNGAVLAAQNVNLNSSATGFAIQRDASNNFVANIAATWSLTNVTGGVVNGDLVVAGDSKSAVFTAHVAGSAKVSAAATGLNGVSGTLTAVVPTFITIETAANGTGTPVGAQNLASGTTITAFAIQRDISGTFLANVAGTWTLSNLTGGVVNGDLVPAVDGKSAVMIGHRTGSAKMSVGVNGSSGLSGTLTVVAGPISALFVESASDGTGANVGAQDLLIGSSLVVYAIQRDASGNFISNVAAVWTLSGESGGVILTDLTVLLGTKSAAFTGHAVGTTRITASAGGLLGSTGILNVKDTSPAPDTTAPDVNLTSPLAGSTVSASVSVAASATDNTGIVGVQFLLDGTNLGAERTALPYSTIWDTTKATNGIHILTAIARDAAGNKTTSVPISVSVSNAPVTTNYSVPPNGSLTLETTDSDSPNLSVSHARLEPDVSNLQLTSTDSEVTASKSLAGVAIMGLRQNGVIVSEAGVPAGPEITNGRIYAEVGGLVNTGIALSNDNPQDAVVSFYFTDTAGVSSASGSLTVKARQQVNGFLNAPPFNLPPAALGTFTFSSSLPIGATALRGLTNERGEFLITTMPVASIVPDSGVLVVPQFADGAGWRTRIVLTNPSESPIQGTLEFFGHGAIDQTSAPLNLSITGPLGQDARYNIAPHATAVFVTTGDGTDLRSGSIRITPIPATPFSSNFVPNALAIFSYRSQGVTVTEAAVSGVSTGTSFRMYAEASAGSDSGSIQTGFAIANPSSKSVDVSIELFRQDGSTTGLIQSVRVPAGGQVAEFINDKTLFPTIPLSFKGTAKVTSSSPFALIALRTRYNERGDYLITTTPPLNESIAQNGALVFPHIVSGQGWTTQIIVFGQTGSGRLYLMSQDGTTRPSSSLVPPK